MEPILTDLSDAALGRASKDNLTAFFRFLGRAPSVDFFAEDGLARWRTGVDHPWFNGLYLDRTPHPGDELLPQETAEYFRTYGVSEFTVWLNTDVERELWHSRFDAAGYRYDVGAPGMAYLLNDLPPRALPPGFTVEKVRDSATLDLWCRTFFDGYELPHAWYDAFAALMHGLGFNLPMANYLGLIYGEPVTTSSIFYGAGVAGVQFVATLFAARRMGLGGHMTMLPLQDARALGCRAAILQSSDMGFSLYQSLGFRKVYDVDNYACRTAPPGG